MKSYFFLLLAVFAFAFAMEDFDNEIKQKLIVGVKQMAEAGRNAGINSGAALVYYELDHNGCMQLFDDESTINLANSIFAKLKNDKNCYEQLASALGQRSVDEWNKWRRQSAYFIQGQLQEMIKFQSNCELNG